MKLNYFALRQFTIAFCLLSLLSFSQTLFQKSFSNIGVDKGTCVIKTSDGGYLEGGTSGNGGLDKYYLVKTDYAGGVQWSKTYGGTVSEYLASIQQTADGGYILCGTTFSFNTQPFGDIWIVKINSSGNITWQNHYGYTGYDYGYSIQQTPDLGYIVGGLTSSFGAGYYDYFIMKIDSIGNAIWGTTIGGAANDEGYAIIQTNDGGYMIAGQEDSYSTTQFNPYQIMLSKLNSSGTVVWSKSYGGGNAAGNYICNSMRKTTDGGAILVGWTDGIDAGMQDVYLLKVDSLGTTQWAKTYGGVASDFGNDVRQISGGGYAIAGTTNSFGAGNNDAYLITTDSNGNLIWSVCFGDTLSDTGNSLDQTADGGFILAGQTDGVSSNAADMFLVKCDAAGSTGCRENDATTTVLNHTPVETLINPLISSNALWQVTSGTTGTGCNVTTFCNTVGINSLNSSDDLFSVFPNPASDQISFSKALNGVEVYSVFGELLFSENNKVATISLINFADGIYIVKSENMSAKFVVKH
ncbi:hypothetical protein BH09BAC5_BH09BAC5_23980 [soil metagenome]